MVLIFVFSGLYLILLSVITDRYHKNLRKIVILQNALKHPKADKPVLWKKKDEAIFILKREKRLSYYVLVGLAVIHQISGFINAFMVSLARFELNVLYFSPVVELVFFCTLLAIIFWLKGAGGGIPRSGDGDNYWSHGF